MQGFFHKILLFLVLTAAITDALAVHKGCGGYIAGGGGGHIDGDEDESDPRWNAVLNRLKREGVLTEDSFDIRAEFFGFEAMPPLPAIPLGTLTRGQFHSAWQEARSVVPGLIYTQLVVKWAKQIERDYGAPRGQLFLVMLLNPDQTLQRSSDDLRIHLADKLLRTTASLGELAAVRKNTLPNSFRDWENECWAFVQSGLESIERDIRNQDLFATFESYLRKMDTVQIPGFKQIPRRSKFRLEAPAVSTVLSSDGTEMIDTTVSADISLTEVNTKRPPGIVLNTTGYGIRGEYFGDWAVDRVEYNGDLIGLVLALSPETAAGILSDLGALRSAVSDTFQP